MFNFTPVVRNIIIICVGVFLIDAIFSRMNVNGLLALYRADSPYWRPYQLFTYMFAHGGIGHLFFNMLSLTMIGSVLEMIWGQQKFLLFYMATTIGAALIYLGMEYFLGRPDPFGLSTMVGASGAIYGLLAAFGILMPDREFQLLLPPISVKAKYMVFIMGFFTYAVDKSGQVAHFAHLGGAVIAFFLLKVMRF